MFYWLLVYLIDNFIKDLEMSEEHLGVALHDKLCLISVDKLTSSLGSGLKDQAFCSIGFLLSLCADVIQTAYLLVKATWG